MHTDTIASERFWASLLEMLPPASRNVSRGAGLPMQTGTDPAKRLSASFSERLPRVVSDPPADVLPAVYLSPFRRQSSTYVVWEGISDALSGCSHSRRTWIHPRREYLCRISLRRLSLRNAARVRCATSLISVSVCMSVWLHVGLYVYVCVSVLPFFSVSVRTRPCPRAMRSRWSAQD